MNEPLYRKAMAIRHWALEERLIPAGASDADVSSDDISLVAQAFSDSLSPRLQKSGLTGVGISEKSNSIVIYTATGLFKADRENLPREIFDGVSIKYRRATPFTLKDDMPEVAFGEEAGSFFNEKYTCGSSVSVGNRRTAGTLGCIVSDQSGARYGLTNNHVTGGCNYTRKGMPIIAPGVKDISSSSFAPFSIGTHAHAIPMVLGEPGTVDHSRNTDAAVFALSNQSQVSSMQRDYYDTPETLAEFSADIETGTPVKKVGRTTGQTFGFVESLNVGPLALDYDIPTYHSANEAVKFQGRVYFEPVYIIRGHDGPFSLKGDSGALVVTNSGEGVEGAIGLIFAGDVSENLSYMLPLAPILEELDMKLVSGLEAD